MTTYTGQINNDPGPVSYWTPGGAWPSSVGASAATLRHGKCARRIVVGVSGILSLAQCDGTVVTFTAAQVNNLSGVIDGNFAAVLAASAPSGGTASTAYGLQIGF
jgi:hypothetical protein